MQHHEIERARLNERIRSISDGELRKKLRNYRIDINKRENILKRGAQAVMVAPKQSGGYAKGNRGYRAHDELELCHKFLDDHNVPRCDWHVQLSH